MESGDSVHLVRTNNGQMGHADLLRLCLLNDGHAVQQSTIIGELHFNLLQKELFCVVHGLGEMGSKRLDFVFG